MFRDLVAGFCDEQRAVLIEEMDGAHLVLLAHQGDRLADEAVGLLDEIVEQVVDIMRDAGRLLPGGVGGRQPGERLLGHGQRGNIEVDAENGAHAPGFVADVDGRRFQQLAVRRAGEIAQLVLRRAAVLAELIEHDL